MENEPRESDNGVPFADVPAVSDAIERLKSELDDLQSATSHIEASKKAASKAAEAADQVTSSTATFASSTESLIARVEAIDFPERFNALEEATSEMKTLLSDELGRAKSEISDLTDKQEASASAVEAIEDKVERLTDGVREVRKELRSATVELQKNREQLESTRDLVRQKLDSVNRWMLVIGALILFAVVSSNYFL